MQTILKKYIRYSFSLLMLFTLGAGMLFTSCEDDDDEEKSNKIELLSYGPMPIARGAELRFIGHNLERVTAVVIPDGIEIPSSDFTTHTPDLITLTVPQNAEEGLVVLETPEGDITTKTPIGFSEPISIEEFSPDSVKPGDVLTIKGDYLNLIKEVIFFDRIIAADSTHFDSQNRKELKVIVPDKAQTGIIGVSNGAEDPIIVYTEEELEIVLPVISGIAPTTVKAGETLTITGSNLDIVRSIKYAGDAVTDSVVSVNDAGEELVVYVAEKAHDGPVTVMPGSGVEVVSEDEIELLTPSIVSFGENPVKPGTGLTVTGEDMDLVTEIRFGDVIQSEVTVISETEIEFTVPVEAPGGSVNFVTAAGKEVVSPEELQMILPEINEISPDAAYENDTIKLGGENLDLVESVTFFGGTNAEASYDEENDSVSVVVPNTAQTGPLTIIAKNREETVTSQSFTFISINVPVVTNAPISVMPGSLLVIEGEKLDLLTDVIFPGNITATMFANKSATRLEVYVPENVEGGKGVIDFITVTGEETQSPEIIFGVDPIYDEEYVYFNFNGTGKDSWWGEAMESGPEDNPSTSADGTPYWRVNGISGDGWWDGLFFRNGGDNIKTDGVDVNTWVVKFDLATFGDFPTAGTLKVRLGGDPDTHLADFNLNDYLGVSKVDGWITVSIPLTEFYNGEEPLSDISVAGSEFGMIWSSGEAVEVNIGIDNVRFEPQQ